MSRHWVSTQSHPKHHTSKKLILVPDHRYASTRWNPYARTPFSLGNRRNHSAATARQDETHTRASSGPGGQRSRQVAVTALTSSCCSPAWACSARSPGGRNLLWCFCISGWMYLLCALLCLSGCWTLMFIFLPPASSLLSSGNSNYWKPGLVQHMRPQSATGRGRQICSTPHFCVWMAFYPIHPRTPAR